MNGPTLVIRTVEPKFMARAGSASYPMFVELDGQRQRLQVGDNAFHLAPGRWDVFVYCFYFGFKVGKARLTVDNGQGPVLLHYSSPHTIYSAGALGYEPVDKPGKRAGVGIVLLALTVPLIIIAAALLAQRL